MQIHINFVAEICNIFGNKYMYVFARTVLKARISERYEFHNFFFTAVQHILLWYLKCRRLLIYRFSVNIVTWSLVWMSLATYHKEICQTSEEVDVQM